MHINITKYLEIPYRSGGSDFSGIDCFGLVRLFFKTEFDHEIPAFEYGYEWAKSKQDPIKKHYGDVCEKVNGPIRYGIVGFRMPGYFVEHHLGVVLYDFDQFLHSPLDKPSCTSKLSHPVWNRSVSAYYRVIGIGETT